MGRTRIIAISKANTNVEKFKDTVLPFISKVVKYHLGISGKQDN